MLLYYFSTVFILLAWPFYLIFDIYATIICAYVVQPPMSYLPWQSSCIELVLVLLSLLSTLSTTLDVSMSGITAARGLEPPLRAPLNFNVTHLLINLLGLGSGGSLLQIVPTASLLSQWLLLVSRGAFQHNPLPIWRYLANIFLPFGSLEWRGTASAYILWCVVIPILCYHFALQLHSLLMAGALALNSLMLCPPAAPFAWFTITHSLLL